MLRDGRQDAEKKRFFWPVALTISIVLTLAVLTFLQAFGLALCLGVAVGALAFLRGTAASGRLGNARCIGQAGPDISMRIGACLALAGILSGAQGHDPAFAWPVRVALAVGQLALSALAVGLAGQNAKQARLPKTTQAVDDGAARL